MKRTKYDYHEGLSDNQCRIILHSFGLDAKKFYAWMGGQTCPLIPRHTEDGEVKLVAGVYEYDLFRWIRSQIKGHPLVWD